MNENEWMRMNGDEWMNEMNEMNENEWNDVRESVNIMWVVYIIAYELIL